MRFFIVQLLVFVSTSIFASDSTTLYVQGKKINIGLPDGYVDYYKLDSQTVLEMAKYLIPEQQIKPVCVFVPFLNIFKSLANEEQFIFSNSFILYQSKKRQYFPLMEVDFRELKEQYLGLDYQKVLPEMRSRLDSFLTHYYDTEYQKLNFNLRDLSITKHKDTSWAYKITFQNLNLVLNEGKYNHQFLQAVGPVNIGNRAFSFSYTETLSDSLSIVGFESKLEKILNKLATPSPFDYIDFYDLGLKCITEKRNKEALNYLNSSIALNGNFDDAYFQRSFVKTILGDKSGAEIDLQKCLSLNPKHFNSSLNLGILYNELNEHSKAVYFGTKAIEIEPNAPDAYYNRGCAFHKSKKYQEAIMDFSKAINLDKQTHVAAYFSRGVTKGELGDHQGAIADYNKALELNPHFVEAYYNRGLTKKKLKDYNGAILDYNKAIELNPNYVDAYNNRGSSKLSLEDYKAAITDYNKAIELNPMYSIAYQNRGIAKIALGLEDSGCMDLYKAVKLGYEAASVWINKFCK
jgi:tetratricopeptide (TPR) repeat protein